MVIDEDGYVSVTIGGTEKSLDLYGTYNRVVAIAAEHPDPETRLPALQDFAESLGFPKCSQRVAVRFNDEIHRTVGELEKKDLSGGSGLPTANSASSTDSPSSI